MKTRILGAIFIVIVMNSMLVGQSPGRLNYQGIVRNSSSEPIANQAVAFRFSVLDAGSNLLYSEIQYVTTSDLGMVNLTIGEANPAQFAAIDWSSGNCSLRVECDPAGGTNYVISETNPLNSVPYALYGEDADADPVNELQTISRSGNIITLSQGGGSFTDAVDDADASVTNEIQTITRSGNIITLSLGGGSFTDEVDDADNDPANELQTISLAGNELSISGTNSVTLAEQTSPWLYSASDIYYNSGKVGIGTDEPLYNFHLMAQPVAGSETILRAMVADDPASYLEIGNGTITDDKFLPSIISHNGADHRQDLFIMAQTTDLLDDTGGFPIITFDARRIDGPAINRPLFQWSSYGNPKMTMLANGNIGIGTTSPIADLQISDNTTSLSSSLIVLETMNAKLRLLAYEKTPSLWIQAGSSLETGTTADLGFSGMNGGPLHMMMKASGKIGIGTADPAGKLQVNGGTEWSDEEPLFEVRNKYGDPVFSVFNNGVRVNIEDADTKGPRGGFAIGGFDRSKGEATVDFMRISPDSIRFNINNDPDAKGPRGGFAIGGFDRSKGPVNEDFMYITPQLSNSGQYNTFFGYHSGISNESTGLQNTFLGYEAGLSNTTGDWNLFIGNRAGANNIGGSQNIAIGDQAGKVLSGGLLNIFMGNLSGGNILNGSKNLILGHFSGSNLINGSNNIFIGNLSGLGYADVSNQLWIGQCLDLLNPKPALIWGNFESNQVVINGKGNDNPLGYTFYVNGRGGGDYAWNSLSDVRLKKNVSQIEDPLEKILNLRGVTFEWKDIQTEEPGIRMGFIAQEALEIIPEVVDNSGDYMSMQYAPITAILVEGIKEQQKIIESQDSRISALEDELAEIKEMVGRQKTKGKR